MPLTYYVGKAPRTGISQKTSLANLGFTAYGVWAFYYRLYMRFLRKILSFLLLLSFGIISDLFGQTSNNVKDTVLNEITISAHKIPKEIIPVQRLGEKQLKSLSSYSVADAVRYFSGVQIKDYGGVGGLKTINIRSMGSHHVGIFYDGIEIGNAQNGVIDLGRFSLDNMEAISMYNGQKSSILQPAKDYSSSSSFYMVTRLPIFKSGKTNNFNIGLKGGSFGTINPSFLWEHKLNDKISSSFNTEYMYTTGKYKFTYKKKDGYDTTATRQNGDVKMFRAEGALFGEIKDGEWRAKIYYYKSERGYPGAFVREEPGTFKHQDRQYDDNFFVQGSLKKNFTTWYALLLNSKYAYDYLHYLSDPKVDISTNNINNKYKQQEYYISAAHCFNVLKWWNLSLSNDFQLNDLNADLKDFVYPKRFSFLSAASTSIDFNRFKIQGSLLHTFIREKTNNKLADAPDKSKLSPSIILSWQPFKADDLKLRAFYKKIFRMPTLNDLYYTFIGNKDVNPEYTVQYNVGMTYSKQFNNKIINSIEAQIDAYFNQIDDKIIAMPTSNQFRWTIVNLGYVEIRGIDISLRSNWNIGKVLLSAYLSYTYQKAQDFTDKTSKWYGGQIPYTPWHSGSAILNGEYRGWSINYSYIYTGERYTAIANIPENYTQPWYTHDMGISKLFALNNALNLKVTTEVNNIFNQQYEVVQCYPMPGTNFKLRINLLF